MDFRKTKAPLSTITRDMNSMCEPTGNVYETVNVIGKRANQISLLIRDELDQKLKEFTSVADSLEEVFENREQIELSRFYERLPKPTLIAAQEYVDNKLFHRKAIK
ncbi:DNA-directed RNA polymerase subunit omega [Paludibacter jiangxiensis]|uniref:RNA polymerase Rpb6 n=1 Tax=Paludibacter jiangxiensis TaxID=681398 RepID=A0A161LFZ9_9BACT|nr:DNA-directed RNA polymerase subunit omega [Paludibacter jiangxiensis]MDP4204009.1 DNA-directed RNA polymerase subunit omega [Bacteroidota bacterium]MTK06045.1 DNA-directed RNA polymerase subunit omega [Hungatella sp.]MTK06568.1 DNA-directed RNA polymerase subunit omega [Hungatella sp.]GAT64205.1 RNA polymerase Rpb6 [Paludibacter jiangxiensis]